MIHTERVAQPGVLVSFYEMMDKLGVDYDIIGLSYYPYFHGNLRVLDYALSALETKFPEKNIMIVETGYPYKWEVPGSTEKVDYPYSEEGQDEFAQRLVALLERHEKVNGLFWWWLEYNAYGTTLSGWYNAPLFDSTSGKACKALKTICSFRSETGSAGLTTIEDDIDRQWYDLSGRSVDKPTKKGIYVSKDKKMIIM